MRTLHLRNEQASETLSGMSKLEPSRANFFLDEVLTLTFLQKIFLEKKKNQNIVRITTHAHSFDGPVQLPLGHQHTAEEFLLNHTFNIQHF